MQSQPIHGNPTGDRSSLAHEDDEFEFAVISHLAYLHPTQLTLDEAVLELADASRQSGSRAGVQDAVRSLTRVGLLREHDAYIVPTRATLRLVELWQHN